MKYKNSKRLAIIVDLDGTLFFVGDRSYFDARNSHETDTLNEPVAETIRLFREDGYRIIFVTGSNEKSRISREKLIRKTMDWEKDYDYDLYMRPDGDYRPDTVFKNEIWNKHIKDNFHVLMVLEDRQKMVDFYRNDLKMPCFQVNPDTGKKKKSKK